MTVSWPRRVTCGPVRTQAAGTGHAAGTGRAVAAGLRLAAQLGRYDLGYWSRYDLRFTAPASLAYHCLHISLLEVAGRLLAEGSNEASGVSGVSGVSGAS